jgi:chemotaxis protein methyltransferase CheR
MSPTRSAGYRLLRDYVRNDCGLSLSMAKLHVAEARLRDLLRAEGLDDLGQLALRARAETDQRLRRRVIAAMCTGETRWLRNEAAFRLFTETLLPAWEEELRQGRRERIRVWSAACATGQEADSLALAFVEHARRSPVLELEHLELLATDVDEGAVNQARQGLFPDFAMEELDSDLRERYFRREDRRWRLDAVVRDRVRVESFNLQDDVTGLGPFDLVLVRNAAAFFTDAFRRDLFARLRAVLAPGGRLLLGATETLGMAAAGWEPVDDGPGVSYRSRDEVPEPARLRSRKRSLEARER